MTHWLAVNFPPSTLPLFLPLFFGGIALNVALWHHIQRRNR